MTNDRSEETAAVIATALALFMEDEVHDREPGILTFSPVRTEWSDRILTFRKIPKIK